MHFFSPDNIDQIYPVKYPENFGYYPADFAMTFYDQNYYGIQTVNNTHTNTDCSGKKTAILCIQK